MASSNRSKFLEMCDGLLARVEPPLRSVLEQASKCTRILYPACRRDIHNASFPWVLAELGQISLAQLTTSCLAVTGFLKHFHTSQDLKFLLLRNLENKLKIMVGLVKVLAYNVSIFL